MLRVKLMLLKFLLQLPLAWLGFLEPKTESQATRFASVVYTGVSDVSSVPFRQELELSDVPIQKYIGIFT